MKRAKKSALPATLYLKALLGRTDLYGGDYGAILVSVRERLAIVADDCAIFPGHGPSSTMAYERKVNPMSDEAFSSICRQKARPTSAASLM